MDTAQLQKEIDALTWYHDFDFGNGLKARSVIADDHGHRKIWPFIEGQLDRVDFRGKSVLDIGCWDGYWSFYAERRGARAVLATDDHTQNWMGSQGIHLARRLLGSAVRLNLNASAYDLAALDEKFDVILFLGVYYHLLDPLHALAQIRHCCHRNTVVVIDGPVATALPAGAGLFNFAHHACEFLPTPDALRQLLTAAYFNKVESARLELTAPPAPPAPPPGRLGWRWRLSTCLAALSGSRPRVRELLRQIEPPPPPPPAPHESQRMVVKCVPFEGKNALHDYKPPFGLHVYDDRYREKSRSAGAA